MLIHIGYPKAGSTYLQTWFGKHPSMYYNPTSVAGFYSSWDLSRYAATPGKMHECFVLSSEHLSLWRSDVDIVGLKGTVFYDVKAYQQKLCETLHNLFPHAKVLIVPRGFTSMFPSFYSQYVSSGGIQTWAEIHAQFAEFFSYSYDYTRVIKLYREIYGAENVLVLPYELLRADPAKFTAIIEDAMGVKEKYVLPDKVNASLDKKVLASYRKVNRFMCAVLKPFPYSFQRLVYYYYIQKLEAKKPHPFMQFLTRFSNEEVNINGVEETLKVLKGKAEILRNEKLFEPYLSEYLL
ncbi:MAG: hypothetical protein JWO06_497 [Bacteroidota bacterium]|nr:hypothetical protein [Bacteroidota bacterium]